MNPQNYQYAFGIMNSCIITILIIFLFLSNFNLNAQQLAFPAASGAGAYATGGRGGTVLHVTNLNDSGPGSFREAFTMSGARIIVFDVSGTIECLTPLSTAYDDVTVAGQSAPEGGITFTGNLGGSPIFEISGKDNMIFRHIRVRPTFIYGGDNADSFQCYSCTNVIIDHCSFSWGGDECISITGVTQNVSIQNSIIAESKTGSIMGNPSTPANAQNLSMNGNLFFQIGHRHPNTETNGRVDVINNVIYGYRGRTNLIYEGFPKLNEINNYYITDTPRPLGEMGKVTWHGNEPQIYTKGNLHLPSIVTDSELINNNNTWTAFGTSNGAFAFNYNGVNYYDDDPAPNEFFTSVQHPLLGHGWNILTALQSLEHAKTDVGANKTLEGSGNSIIDWDDVDDYYLTNVINQTLLTVNSPFTMAGKAHYETFLANVSATPINSRSASYYVSSPHIPELWFLANVPEGESATDFAPSGYTWIEEFLNEVDGNNNTVNANAGQDQNICDGQSATLTASGGDTYLWSTGETTQSITVTPNTTTTYSVTAFVGSESDTDDVVVNVNQMPTANAGTDQTICSGETITLTASGGSSYLWNTGATTSSINVSPNSSTTYSVTVTQNGCSDTDDVIVNVNASPNANAGNDISILEGESTTLSASGGDTYLWSTGETTQTITVTPNTTTTYSVTAFINGCQDSDDVVVTVESEVIADAGEDVTICEDSSTTLTASGGTSYLWSTGETTQSITVSPNATTTYSVTVSSGSSSDIDDVTVNVNPNPIANAGNDVTISEGENITLTASGGDSYVWSTGETTQSITVSPTSTTTYTVIVILNGCEDTDDVIVIVETEQVVADAGADVDICQGDSVTLTAYGGTDYLWSTGETTQSITVNPNSTTNYTVIVSNETSSDTDDVTVEVNPVPNVTVSNDATILEGNYITLSASGANNYEWSNGATQPNIAVSPSVTTTYVVTGYINNCYDVKDVTVSVVEQVIVDAGDDTSICLGDEITLTANASGAEDYLWNTGETTQSITVSPNTDTMYTVIASNSMDSEADDIMVSVNACEEEEIIPEDEEFSFIAYIDSRVSEDILNVKLTGLEDHCALYLFDISGKLIHTDEFNGNEGEEVVRTINTSQISDGVYIIKVEDTNSIHSKSIVIR